MWAFVMTTMNFLLLLNKEFRDYLISFQLVKEDPSVG
jgi:hypothetical protein